MLILPSVILLRRLQAFPPPSPPERQAHASLQDHPYADHDGEEAGRRPLVANLDHGRAGRPAWNLAARGFAVQAERVDNITSSQFTFPLGRWRLHLVSGLLQRLTGQPVLHLLLRLLLLLRRLHRLLRLLRRLCRGLLRLLPRLSLRLHLSLDRKSVV